MRKEENKSSKECVDIFDVSYEGAGVGKIGGQIVFVPKTLPEEQVEVEIVKRSKSFLNGRLLGVKVSNQLRIEPKCPYFEMCGGCDFQHCDREYELFLKQKILKSELAKVGFCGDAKMNVAPQRYAYRNKVKFEIKDGKLGYFKPKSHVFFEVKFCPIACEEINQIIPKIEQFLTENRLKFLKNVYIKKVDGNIAICFLFDKNAEKMQKNVKNLSILDDFFVFFAYGDVLESNKTKVETLKTRKSGSTKLSQNVYGMNVSVDVSAFNQVNDGVAKLLYDFVVEETKGLRVVNAYSGQGLLSALICQNAKFVYGIEVQRSAHESAEDLRKELWKDEFRMENICGLVEEELSKIVLRDKIDCIVLDPAREGCKREVLEVILHSGIDKTIYISCNFSTLTRDLRFLTPNFDIVSVQIFDMFPCTANLETVVVLRQKKEI